MKTFLFLVFTVLCVGEVVKGVDLRKNMKMDEVSWKEEDEVLKAASGSLADLLAMSPAGTHLYHSSSPLAKTPPSETHLLQDTKNPPQLKEAGTLQGSNEKLAINDPVMQVINDSPANDTNGHIPQNNTKPSHILQKNSKEDVKNDSREKVRYSPLTSINTPSDEKRATRQIRKATLKGTKEVAPEVREILKLYPWRQTSLKSLNTNLTSPAVYPAP